MSAMFEKTERTLATVGAMALFTLNEFRMYQFLPHTADPAHGRIYGIWMQLMGQPGTAYLNVWDLGVRWALAALTFGCAMWALAETLKPTPGKP